MRLSQVAPTGSEFRMLPDADLPGNDIATPWTDPRLGDLSLDQCRDICAGMPACVAFTYNRAARACFPKGATGPAKPFPGAISGTRSAASSAPAGLVPAAPLAAATAGAREVAFEMTGDADLPGNDYRSGLNDPALRGISLESCQAACATDDRCRAFTFNQSGSYCFLKTAAAQPSYFQYAISGRKVWRAVDPLAFRANESNADRVARIREEARSFGGPCDEERATLEELQRTTGVTAETTSVAAGAEVQLAWQRQRPAPQFLPAYLVIAADHPIRLGGDRFYGLLPEATAPFGIATFASDTRAIVPLWGDAPKAGEISIRPLMAEGLKLSWSVVGYLRGCEEEVDGPVTNIDIDVAATGAPTIVLEAEADLTAPTERIGAPEGAAVAGRIVEIRSGRYRLVDESGYELAERSGRNPRFSPTGRFVAARADDGTEILDAVDGALVYKDNHGGPIAWADADSFVVLAPGPWGRVEVIAPVHGGRSILGINTGCHVCDGLEAGVRIDLENDLVITAAKPDYSDSLPSWSGGARLSGPAETIEQESAARGVLLAAFSLPQRWDLGGTVRFTQGYEVSPGQSPLQAGGDASAPEVSGLPSELVQPRRLSRQEAALGTAEVRLEEDAWRGIVRTASPGDTNQILPRLAEFGLPIPTLVDGDAGTPFSGEVLVLSTDGEGGLETDEEKARVEATANRIRSEVHSARAALLDQPLDALRCDPAESHLDPGTDTLTILKIYDEFQRAFRFQSGDRTIWVTHQQCRDGSAAFSYPTVGVFDTAAPAAWFPDTDDPASDVHGAHGDCRFNISDCAFDARLFGDRFLVLSSALSRAIEVYDLDTRRNLFRKYELPRGDLLQHAIVTKDGRGVLQVNSDGTFFLYAMAGGAKLLQGRQVDDELVVWTPDMHFDATPEGANFVWLRFPGQPGQYSLQQFDARLRVPGLARQVLAGSYRPGPLEVGVPPRLTGSLASAQGGRIRGSATATAPGGLREIRVYQDGVLTDTIATTAGGDTIPVDVARLPGARWVSLLAVDAQGLASTPISRDLGPDGSRARVHVLSVGIDDYGSADVPDLSFAVSDARNIASSIAQVGMGRLDVGQPELLIDSAATGEAILAATRRIVDEAEPGDTIVFFFAGHGLKGPNGRFYMGTPGVDPSDITGTALAWDDLATALARSRARVAVFLDACHSGTAGTTDFFATNDEAASGIMREIPSGLVVFAASKGREVSRENAEVGGGLFTTSLADVVANGRAHSDTNGNGAIEISELYVGVKRQVVEDTSGQQTPWLARNQMIGDFALF